MHLIYTQLQEEVQLDQEKEQEKEQDNVQEKEPEQENYRVVMGKFVCTHCGKEYKQLGSLVKHLKKTMTLVLLSLSAPFARKI